MLSVLSDTERAVVETITMRMLPNEALQYLKDCGIEISRRSYFRHKAKLDASKWERFDVNSRKVHRTTFAEN
jgi:hypothetical protein